MAHLRFVRRRKNVFHRFGFYALFLLLQIIDQTLDWRHYVITKPNISALKIETIKIVITGVITKRNIKS